MLKHLKEKNHIAVIMAHWHHLAAAVQEFRCRHYICTTCCVCTVCVCKLVYMCTSHFMLLLFCTWTLPLGPIKHTSTVCLFAEAVFLTIKCIWITHVTQTEVCLEPHDGLRLWVKIILTNIPHPSLSIDQFQPICAQQKSHKIKPWMEGLGFMNVFSADTMLVPNLKPFILFKLQVDTNKVLCNSAKK